MAAEYVTSYRFMHAARQSRPTKAVSMARAMNKNSVAGRPVGDALPLDKEFWDFIVAAYIVNASLRKF